MSRKKIGGFKEIQRFLRKIQRTTIRPRPPGPSGRPSKNRSPRGRSPVDPFSKCIFSRFQGFYTIMSRKKKRGFSKSSKIFQKHIVTYFYRGFWTIGYGNREK
uniref:Uncharacterized protein n=1 Tax=viral metagenome TaxID=1070528 RepID=A0A6C0DY74_9ZZZZ